MSRHGGEVFLRLNEEIIPHLGDNQVLKVLGMRQEPRVGYIHMSGLKDGDYYTGDFCQDGEILFCIGNPIPMNLHIDKWGTPSIDLSVAG